MSRKCNPRRTSIEVSGRHHRTREPVRMTGISDTGPEIPDRAVLAAAGHRRVDTGRAAVHPKGSCDLPRLDSVSTHPFGMPQRFFRRFPPFSSCAVRNRQDSGQTRSALTREPYAVESFSPVSSQQIGHGRGKERNQGVFSVYQVSMIHRRFDAPGTGAGPFSLDPVSTGGVVRPGCITFFRGSSAHQAFPDGP
jgi:hypothetical protein